MDKEYRFPTSTEECINLLIEILNNPDSEFYDDEFYSKQANILFQLSGYIKRIVDLYNNIKYAEGLGLELNKLREGGFLDGTIQD